MPRPREPKKFTSTTGAEPFAACDCKHKDPGTRYHHWCEVLRDFGKKGLFFHADQADVKKGSDSWEGFFRGVLDAQEYWSSIQTVNARTGAPLDWVTARQASLAAERRTQKGMHHE